MFNKRLIPLNMMIRNGRVNIKMKVGLDYHLKVGRDINKVIIHQVFPRAKDFHSNWLSFSIMYGFGLREDVHKERQDGKIAAISRLKCER